MGHTFEIVAREYIETNRAGWKNAKHGQQWLNTLGQYAFPVIGETDVREIGLDHVLRILKPICAELPETASRVRGRTETI